MASEKPTTLSRQAYTYGFDEIATLLQTSVSQGLTTAEAERRLLTDGPNRLKPPKKVSPFKILFRQVANAMTVILLAAMAVSFGVLDFISGGVIAALAFVNVTVGFTQEWSAAKIVAALETVGSPEATVVRNGRRMVIKAEQVVKGDIILVRSGDVVPADARIIKDSFSSLETDEALLTGESLPVQKQHETLQGQVLPVGDQADMVFSGSQVAKGRAKAIVTQTGMQTELGKIAQALDASPTKRSAKDQIKAALGLSGGTPLQIRMNKLAYVLLIVAIVLAVVVVASTAFKNIPDSIATYAVATAVSLIPASLIAVVSLTLTSASRQLAKRNALVRRLDSVESLGSVTDICSDKTGTITTGKMILRKAFVLGTKETFVVEGGTKDPFYPRGKVVLETSKPIEIEESDLGDQDDTVGVDPASLESSFQHLVHCASLCNMATLHHNQKEDTWEANGDPTEIALQVFAHKLASGKPHLLKQKDPWELVVEHPFDSTIKRMSTVYKHNDAQIVFLKGAVERVIERCDTEMSEVNDIMTSFTSSGFRVLALASKTIPTDLDATKIPRDELERNVKLLGLFGIYDPPRDESRQAVLDCLQAGIVPRMLTGDHLFTARAIAQEVGIIGMAHPKNAVMEAPKFDAMSDEDIDAMPDLPLVVGRCSPATKVRMVDALHRRNRSCGMTGDGVNDSPALKRADIGIAMGLNGSDVAKNVSDIVLADDNFSTIVRAVRKGRSIFSNLSNSLLYLLSGNIAEVILLLVGLAFKDDTGESVYPLSPVAALWVNTLTAGFPALALGSEPTAKNTMTKSPAKFQTIFNIGWYMDLFYSGLLIGVISIVDVSIRFDIRPRLIHSLSLWCMPSAMATSALAAMKSTLQIPAIWFIAQGQRPLLHRSQCFACMQSSAKL